MADPTTLDLVRQVLAKLGVKPPQESPHLHAQTSVNVTAPVPPYTAPFPANVEEIFLGSAERQPTGVVQSGRYATAPPSADLQALQAYPRVKAAVLALGSKYPLAAGRPDRWMIDSTMAGTRDNAEYGREGDRTLRINPDLEWRGSTPELRSTIAHELVHAGQADNFPDRARSEQAYLAGAGDWATSRYPLRAGELQAVSVMPSEDREFPSPRDWATQYIWALAQQGRKR